MRLDRVDPFQVEWSNHGTLALATESVGIQFLVPEFETLYKSDTVKFNKLNSPKEVAGARVLSMAYGPMLTAKNGGSMLSMVLNTGSFLFMEEDTAQSSVICTYMSPLSTFYTCTCWSGDKALVADQLGQIYVVDHTNFQFAPFAPRISNNETSYIKNIASTENFTVAVLKDNSVWLFVDNGWTNLLQASGINVISIHINKKDILFVQMSQEVIVIQLASNDRKSDKTRLLSFTPGFLITTESSDFFVIHENGKISPSKNDLSTPNITAKVECVTRHPTLPISAIIVGPNFKGWQYPMLSTRVLNLALFPIDGAIEFCFKKAVFPMSYLAEKAHRDLPSKNLVTSFENTEDVSDLKALFLSSQFDKYRFEWLFNDDKKAVLKRIRMAIKNTLEKDFTTSSNSSTMDKMVLLWLACDTKESSIAIGETFTLSGDLISEVFRTEDYFNDTDTITSESGNTWRRCSLTGFPLLSVDIRVSTGGQFRSYSSAPKLVEFSDEDNLLTKTLLKNANFCILSGSLWS